MRIGMDTQNYAASYGVSRNNRAQQQLATGKAINSAADDAAGLAIAKKLESQASGASVASNNAKDMGNLLNLSDGAMSQVNEGLGRVRELALQSMNGIYNDSDRAVFQEEINGILGNINDIAKNTNFNGKNVLDGSFTGQNAAIGPNGESMEINIGGMFTDSLGLSGLDVTTLDGANSALKSVDGALETVATEMAGVGAQTNRLEYAGAVMDNMEYNMEVARSRKEDADIGKSAMENSKNKALEQTQIAMQKLQMEGMGNYLKLIS